MNVIKSLGKRIGSGFANNTRLAVISLILAVIVWLMISMGLDQSASKTVSNIRLVTDTIGTTAADNDLSAIYCDVEKVEVKLKCSKTQIRNINADTLEAYIDFDNVTSAGKRTYPIKLRGNGFQYEIESITPSVASVTLDRYTAVEVPVTPKVPNISFAEGKVPDEMTCEPSEVTVSGPASLLEKVSKCYVYSDKEFADKDSSFTLTADKLQLYSDDDVEIDQSKMTFSNNSYVITVPVLTQKAVQPVVQLSNIPENFNKDALKLKITPESLTIATNNSNAEISDTFEVQKINLSDIDLGYSKDFDINERLANLGMMNRSGVATVNVSLDGTGLDRKEITLDSSSIHLSDLPNDNYNYEPITQKLTITIVGPADVVAQLTSKDFVADASLLNVDKSEQKLSYDAVISCLTSNEVWSVTKAKISIMKTLKTEETTTTSLADNNE